MIGYFKALFFLYGLVLLNMNQNQIIYFEAEEEWS